MLKSGDKLRYLVFIKWDHHFKSLPNVSSAVEHSKNKIKKPNVTSFESKMKGEEEQGEREREMFFFLNLS